MPCGNRLHDVTLGGCFLAAILIGTIPALNAQTVSEPQSRQEQETAPDIRPQPQLERPPSPPAILERTLERIARALEAANAKSDPPEETERAKADLRAQQAMANWAFWVFVATGTQVIVGGIGIFFIWRTLRQNRTATRAAVIAANAAERSTQLAQENFEKIERPYLFVFDLMAGNIRKAPSGVAPYVEYDVANFGKTPAIIDVVAIGFELTDGKIPEALNTGFGHKLRTSDSLSAGKQQSKIKEPFPPSIKFASDVTNWLPRVPPKKVLIFHIVIKYHGPFSREHETSACWSYHHTAPGFMRSEGDKYNYVK